MNALLVRGKIKLHSSLYIKRIFQNKLIKKTETRQPLEAIPKERVKPTEK